jgi:hypothetical protein
MKLIALVEGAECVHFVWRNRPQIEVMSEEMKTSTTADSRQIMSGSCAPLPGSGDYKAAMEAHRVWSEKLGADLVATLNGHTRERGYDHVPNTSPADPKELRAMLAADKSC